MQSDRWFYIDDGPMFKSLEQVIDHYSFFTDGLPTLLQQPVAPLGGQTLSPKSRGVSVCYAVWLMFNILFL